jgi:membrane protein YqaA with SNARE-associated domain
MQGRSPRPTSVAGLAALAFILGIFSIIGGLVGVVLGDYLRRRISRRKRMVMEIGHGCGSG